MGSSRLPRKTLASLGGRAVIDWVIDRCAAAQGVDTVIVATTDLEGDDVLVEHLGDRDVTVIRGSSDDVLDRFRVAAEAVSSPVLMRVTADCPFVAPEILEAALGTLELTGADYVATGLDGRFPRGLDAEAFRRATLLEVASEATDPEEREHVTPFIYRRQGRFACRPIDPPDWAARPDLRFTLDEPADLELASAVVDALGGDVHLPARSIIEHLSEHPELVAINADVDHRTVEF